MGNDTTLPDLPRVIRKKGTILEYRDGVEAAKKVIPYSRIRTVSGTNSTFLGAG